MILIRIRKYYAKLLAERIHLIALTSLFLFLSTFSALSQETLYGFVKLSIDKGDIEGSNIAITKDGNPWKNVNPKRSKPGVFIKGMFLVQLYYGA